MDASIIPYINTLTRFCGVRDVSHLTRAALREKYGFDEADVMVLFGGSILCGGDVLADAIKNGVAKKYVIVGGAGHTTDTLREKMRESFDSLDVAAHCEAELFDGYLKRRYDLSADLLETCSTNCGNNITFLLELLTANSIDAKSIILTQDATMQRRMAATLRKYRPDMTAVSFASYSVAAVEKNGCVAFDEPPNGMWSM